MRKDRTVLDNVLPETRSRALELVAGGKVGAAVKLVRRATNAGPKEAKEYVDGLKVEVLARSVPAEIEVRALSLVAQGKWIDAAKEVREGSPLGLKDAKDYVDGLRSGALRTRGKGNNLSARARALKATDHESAIVLVQTETGMSREEAERFVVALD